MLYPAQIISFICATWVAILFDKACQTSSYCVYMPWSICVKDGNANTPEVETIVHAAMHMFKVLHPLQSYIPEVFN